MESADYLCKLPISDIAGLLPATRKLAFPCENSKQGERNILKNSKKLKIEAPRSYKLGGIRGYAPTVQGENRVIVRFLARMRLRALLVAVAAMASASVYAQAVSVTVTASVGGVVAISPAGINCSAAVCNTLYAPGTTVTLTETASDNFVFTGWGGQCSGVGACTFIATQNVSVSATFVATPSTYYGLTVNLDSFDGTVTSVPAGIMGCSANCTAGFAGGTIVMLAATAYTGGGFTGVNGYFQQQNCISVGNLCFVVMDGNQSVTAFFSTASVPQLGPLTVVVAGNGSVTAQWQQSIGICTAGICPFPLPVDATFIMFTANPQAGNTFIAWGGTCSGTLPNTCTVPANPGIVAFAQFTGAASSSNLLKVALSGPGTVTSLPAGINCPGTCNFSFPVGTGVMLTETPVPGFVFNGWTGACTGSGPCLLTMDAPQSVALGFGGGNTLVTATVYGNGTVTSIPIGISCPGTCSAGFAPGTIVNFNEVPATGGKFSGWGALCEGTGACQITVGPLAANVSAGFSSVQYALTVDVVGNGSVVSNPAGISCTAGTCTSSFGESTQIALTATPAAGYQFAGWGGACTGTSCNFILGDAKTVNAQFVPATGIVPEAGYWWNPADSGSGFVIETQGTSMFMAGFLYASAAAGGEATWIASSGSMASQSQYSGSLVTYSGGQTLTGAYQSATLNPVSPGNISITFTDNSRGSLTWPGGTIPIQRFDFGPGGSETAAPTGTPETGWYWNPAEGGRGFAIEIQGNAIYFAGYMYDATGNPVWYLASGNLGSGDLTSGADLYQGNWQQYANGISLTGTYQAPNIVNANVGSVTLQFSDNSNATLTLPDGRQIPLTRFFFGN